MTNQSNTSVVAIYSAHDAAESAVKKLTAAKINMKSISVIGRGFHSEEKVVGFYNMGDRVHFWGMYGAFWGGLWGLLAGGIYLTMPVIGSAVIVGQFAGMILSTLEGAVVVGSLSAIGASLYSIGIPEDTIINYDQALKTDGFMILVQDTKEEVERARTILKGTGAKHLDMHCCNDKDKIDAVKKVM